MGSGTVGTIVNDGDGPGGVVIIQTNDATGAGCSQTVVNLLLVRPIAPQDASKLDNAKFIATIFDVIESSTCASPAWKCAYTYLK